MNEKMSIKEVYDRCLQLWGLDSQLTLTVEELVELAQAILHLRRNVKQIESIEHFAEELADVELMLDEMKYYFNYIIDYPKYIVDDTDKSFIALIARYRRLKEERLRKRLGE